MAHNMPHQELQSDIREIATSAAVAAVQANEQHFDQHFAKLEQHLDQISQNLDETNANIEFTHKLLHVHIANPSAHMRKS